MHIVYECWQTVNSVESGYCIVASLLNHQTLVVVSTVCHASKQPEHISYEYLENPKVYGKNESAIKCVFHFSLQLLFSILDACRNVCRYSCEVPSVLSMS